MACVGESGDREEEAQCCGEDVCRLRLGGWRTAYQVENPGYRCEEDQR